MTKRQTIRDKALEIISEEPKGIRWAELIKRVEAALPGMEHNTITGSLWNLDTVEATKVYKPDRGVWRHVKYKETTAEKEIVEPPPGPTKMKEESFYAPFADWIKNELEECTKAIALGGNLFKDKWGTPDVLGVRKSKASDIVQFPTEIVSAEVKIDSSALITAFGRR